MARRGHGFCGAGETADLMLELMERMNDPVEAAETAVIAAVCLSRAGRFADGRTTAASRRRASRAGSARTAACTPPRR